MALDLAISGEGPFTTTDDRLDLLSAEEWLNIDVVVESKMRQASEGTLIPHYSIDELVGL
jgi:hypothetical protein